jgi:GLPGLI family protein
MRAKDEAKVEDSKDEKKTEKPQSTNFMDGFEIPKEVIITAWYTPEIPVNQGPEGYWGLPGLILEVNDGKTIILCSKVVMNAKEKVEIKAPNKGKEVTQKEYDEIVTAKMKEMQEMRRSGNGGMRFGR